jgi:putative DNA primase/helicase
MSQHNAALELCGDNPPSTNSVKVGRVVAQTPPKTRNWTVAETGTEIFDCGHSSHGEPSSKWAYNNSEGELIGYVARYDKEGERKQFCPWTPNGHLWKAKKWDGVQPLYGMDLLAQRPTDPVLICEGEKAADAARTICGEEYVCITWPGGASSYKDADWDALTGRNIFLWPDNDKSGLNAATGISAILDGTVDHLATLDVSGMAVKWDAADALDEGWDKPRFDSWLNEQALKNAGASKAETWPELQQLIVQINPQEYPIDELPPLIRSAVEEVCGFVKAPVALVAMSALSSISVAAQAHSDVQRAEKLEGPIGLYFCAIADSGERKTTADGYFTKPLRDYEAREREKAKPLISDHKTEMDAWTAQRGGIQEKIRTLSKAEKSALAQISQLHELDRCKPIPPRVPRLLFSDATPEALALELVFNWPSGGIFSSEAGVVLGGHAMSKDTALRNMARLNQLWDGKISATDRATAQSYGETSVRFTISLQVQEPTLRAFFDNTKGLARGTGFLARFLMAWPTSTMGTRMFSPPPNGWPALAAFNNRLTAILDRAAPVNDDGVLTPTMLTLAPDAKAVWVKIHDGIEQSLACGGDLYDLRDVGSKAADNVVRMAAIFHVFAGSIGPIDRVCIEAAGRIVIWHLIEAKRFLGELAMPPEQANPIRLETWLLDYCKQSRTDRVPRRELQRCGPSGLREKASIDDAIKELAELGRAREFKYGKKKFIQVNPALLAAKP